MRLILTALVVSPALTPNLSAQTPKKGTILARPALRILGPKDVIELRKLRRRDELPFRELAERFGVSIWTAHRLCQNRRLGSKTGGF
jgi:hypothetical protein